MGKIEGVSFVGLNRFRDEVYSLDDGSRFTLCITPHGSKKTIEDGVLYPYIFLRVLSPRDLKECAMGLGNTIMAYPKYAEEGIERFFENLFPLGRPGEPEDILKILSHTEWYLSSYIKWDGDWRFLGPAVRRIIAKRTAILEPDPIIFVDIKGVITSLKCSMFHRAFDPDAINLIARLARKIGAKLILTSSVVQTWASGAEALQQKLIAEGWSAELWHREWMLPVSHATKWQELDVWLARRNCDDLSALIIAPDGNRYPGLLPDDVGDFYTFPADGFTQWNYFEILSILGISDNDVVPPPTRPASGFQTTPSKWHGRKITQASPPSMTYGQPSFPRPS